MHDALCVEYRECAVLTTHSHGALVKHPEHCPRISAYVMPDLNGRAADSRVVGSYLHRASPPHSIRV